MTEKPQDESGAWARFERAVDAAVKSGPKHKTADAPTKSESHSRKPRKSSDKGSEKKK